MARKYRIPLPPPLENSYKITLLPDNLETVVNPSAIPFGRHGLPGSVLDIALSLKEDCIEHSCGGVQACSTCHIYIERGFDSCNELSEREEDYLDKAPGVQLNSRLACCCVPNGDEEIVVQIPKWNKNEVKEGH